ncbi:MAG: TIGR03790 family protein [Opitutales bacterium]
MQPRQIQSDPHAGGVRKLVAILIGVLLSGWVARAADDVASRVIILANADDADSVRIARYYAQRRAVPPANIIALSMPTAETISWRDFVLAIWQPLQDELIRRQWIDGIPMSLFDNVGRRKVAFSGHRISYLVVCRGVPLRLANDPALQGGPPVTPDRPEFRTNQSAVDSELSLLAYGSYTINGFVQNPLYNIPKPPDLIAGTVVKVSRLDGPTPEDVIGLIDGTLEAEANGLIGRAYVDVKGPYTQGEGWLENIVKQLAALHFPAEVNRQPGTFPTGVRCDAPALYFGWYAPNLNGPFALPGFRFAPGAITLHIQSFSAQTLHSDTSGWCGPLVARGAAVTCGAVNEPYLQFMHYPQMLLEALARGETVGDAAYYALPVLSWQNVLVGDPLYRPFKRPLAEQWAHRAELPARLAPYVTLREMHRLVDAGHADEAVALARGEQKDRPSLAVGVGLAELLQARGDKPGMAQAVGFAPYLKSVPTNDWALLWSAAQLLEAAGHPREALTVDETLFSLDGVPASLRLTWLAAAAKTAATTGDKQRMITLQQAAAQLSVPPKNEGGPKSAP